MHRVLEGIRQRRGFYFGPSQHPFTSLQSFLIGYESGYVEATGQTGPEQNLVPRAFHNFVAARYGGSDLGSGWQYYIREHSQDEEAAFKLFFELFSEFASQQPNPALEQTPTADDAGSPNDAPRPQ